MQVLIEGGDGVSYGRPLPAGETYKSRYSAEVSDHVDWQRVHFLGRLSYGHYLEVLQISTVHVYLTYPFVLSWFMLEAMSVGCIVVASETTPVQEVIQHGVNGLLVDFFDINQLVQTVLDSKNLEKNLAMRFEARKTVLDNFDLNARCLPSWIDYLGN